MDAPEPGEVDWSALSPRGQAILAWVAVPLSLGARQKQVAERLNLTRPEIPDLPLPPVVTEGWVAHQMRRLRRELTGEWTERRETLTRMARERSALKAKGKA